MGLIKKSSELSFPRTMQVMIYGQAGMGKTTLALSMPTPLLLDFDGGAKRVDVQDMANVDTVQVTEWAEIKQLLEKEVHELQPYQTIVVDTVGKMVDYIISYKCGTRQPSIRDWSGINAEFSWFTKVLNTIGKHVVFVAHRDTRKNGDDTVFVPTLREKNYNAIVTDLDLLGYMEVKKTNGNEVRTITFDSTSVNDGKNTCGLPGVITIPNFNIWDKDQQKFVRDGRIPNDFMEKNILAPFNQRILEREKLNAEFSELIKKIRIDIESVKDGDGLMNFVKNIDSYKHVGSSRVQAGVMLNARAKELGFHYDSKKKAYVADEKK